MRATWTAHHHEPSSLWSILRNTAWAAAALRGGVEEKMLDIRWSFTGTFYYYTFLKQIAQFLATH